MVILLGITTAMKLIKKALVLFTVILFGSALNAQPFTTQLLYPEEGKRIESTTNVLNSVQTYDNLGNSYICYSFRGTFYLKGQSFEGTPNKNTTNYLLIKFNVNGEVVWSQHFLTPIKNLAASNGELYLTGIPDPNFTIAPAFKDSISLWKSNSFVAQMDSLGVIQWLIYGSGRNNSSIDRITCNSQNVIVSIVLMILYL